MPESASHEQRDLVVSAPDAALTLQAFISKRMSLSRRAAKALIDTRAVWVNRKRVWMAHHALHSGDRVLVPVYADTANRVEVQKLRVLVSDDDYLVIDKPAGVMSVGADSVEERLRTQEGNLALCAVHRLDRDTTGCLVFARRPEALAAAVSEFKKRHVRKSYNAIVSGRYAQTRSTVNEDVDEARAVTHIRLLAVNEDASYLALRIETGRTHQIRKHLAAIRHPILGDREYGPKFALDPRIVAIPRQMLHAAEVEMPHPFKRGEMFRAHSPLPADFRRCLRTFKL
jgi:RluA family pseudouridine synthase